ncbi:MAG: type I DNA topoisomerase [Clostridia bacterium]|nr:type I DNA topoisomerase [Clostridia bacterium]MBQ5794327.1 type I DNA topoisomerase [Clostridia bacterium]
MANLVIVESPSKATTIKGYLGSNYKVIASKGHVRDLPKSTLAVDIENGFDAHYINVRGKGDLIKEIRKEAKHATKVFLATDPDREGEAISWHLAAVLGIPVEKTQRVTFNEVTKTAVKAAIKQPRQIDMDLVDSQRARRIVDRIVGYKISPLLWKNVKPGLSAGRVQSVATKMIVERENEIRAFVPEEYWTIAAHLHTEEGAHVLARFWGDENGKVKLTCREQAEAVVSAVQGKPFTVAEVKRATRHKSPAPPFTTSTMMQEASRKLGFQSQRIMRVAQELYEGINVGSENGGAQGLISYMRTDSLRVSEEAQAAALAFITGKYGEQYCPASPRTYKAKAGAQDAHEAIRPTKVDLEPSKIRKYLTTDQYRLYKLIWERFVASQMQSAELATLSVDFAAEGYLFRTGGYTVTFPGYMVMYEETTDEKADENDPDQMSDIRLPDMRKGQVWNSDEVQPACHFTEPPARYTEATLVKNLEDMGIGRPSTYPTIITNISKNYVSRDGKSLYPTAYGEVTTKLMEENFSSIVDYRFTARMESDLDSIEKGSVQMNSVLEKFWSDFAGQLEDAQKALAQASYELPVEKTDIICDKCGATMIVKNGRFGKFAACPNYPTCKNTKPLGAPKAEGEGEAQTEKKVIVADFKCEKCGGDMVLRSGRYGSFYACANYPTCAFTKPRTKDIGVPCPKCASKVVMKYGRNKTVFYSCEKYPECDFSSWDMPVGEKCPDCGGVLFRKKGKALIVCHDKACGYQRAATETEMTSEGEA